MGNDMLLVASITFLAASGLAIWLWFAMDEVDDEPRAVDGSEGMLFDR